MTHRPEPPGQGPVPAARTGAWRQHLPALAQGCRVMAACAVAYGLTRLLNLEQGYWSVFTVLIIMQSSLGATTGAAVDRLLGTVAGALLGGIGLFVAPPGALNEGLVMVAAIGIATYLSVRWPQLRNAGLTIAILMLTHRAGTPVLGFVSDRILEIALGGCVAVLACATILPVRSGAVLTERLGAVLGIMAEMMTAEAAALRQAGPFDAQLFNPRLRQALTAADALARDSERERVMGLTRRRVDPAISRTLWRLRADVAQIGHLLTQPLAGDRAAGLPMSAADLLDQQAARADQLRQALIRAAAPPAADEVAAQRFTSVFAALQEAGRTSDLPLAELGRIFGLAYTLKRLGQNIRDLEIRIAETRRG